jgi:restriction system protein
MRRRELYELNSRQFERLVERLFSNMGYETELTPPRGDGGRDVIARRTEPGNQQHVLIECKRHERKIGVKDVRALLGIVSNEHASRGIIVAASHFTEGAKKLAQENHRIELIDGLRLVVMLNEYLGWIWLSRLDRLTSERNALAQST